MKVKSESEVTQSCPTLHDPMDCSPPGSSVHGIFQARVLEWGAIAFSYIGHSTEYFSRSIKDSTGLEQRWKWKSPKKADGQGPGKEECHLCDLKQQKRGFGAHTDSVYGCPYAARWGIVSVTKWPLGQLNAFWGQSWCLRWANPEWLLFHHAPKARGILAAPPWRPHNTVDAEGNQFLWVALGKELYLRKGLDALKEPEPGSQGGG